MRINLPGEQSLSFTKQGHGAAVLIVHGIGGHKEDWAATAAALSSRHTVYTVDMLGFGASSKSAESITVASQSDALIALLDAESITSVDLIGNSVGGWVAAILAARRPDRVRRLVLVDPAGFKAMFEGPSPVNFYPQTVADMQNLLAHVRFGEEAHSVTAAQRALDALNVSGDAIAGERVFKGLFVSERLEELLPKITCPSLVVWGADDKLFPAALADMVAGGIRGAQKMLIPQASHFPQLDNPSAFNKTVSDFLQK